LLYVTGNTRVNHSTGGDTASKLSTHSN